MDSTKVSASRTAKQAFRGWASSRWAMGQVALSLNCSNYSSISLGLVDETYVKIKAHGTYLYRAVDKQGKTVDFLLRAKPDVAAAKAFFQRAFKSRRGRQPRSPVSGVLFLGGGESPTIPRVRLGCPSPWSAISSISALAGRFRAPVSAGGFPISVSAVRRPVR
jgi:DDE domain